MIPLEDFFRSPACTSVRISPDGAYLAWLAPFENRLNIHVRAVGGSDVRRLTASTERDIDAFFWADAANLVYSRDQGGDENFRLYQVHRDGGSARDLTPFDSVRCGLIDPLEDVDGEILFQMNQRSPQVFDVYRIHVETGSMQLVAENPGNIQSWMTDHRGQVRLALETDGVNTTVLHRRSESEPFTRVTSYDFKENASPQYFTPDNENLYAISNVGRDKYALVEIDLADGRETRVLFEHPDVDVSYGMYSRHLKKLVGALFEEDRLGYEFFDEDRESLQEWIDAQLPDAENRVTSLSRDERRGIVYRSDDRDTGDYYLLDRDANSLTKLFDTMPWIEPSAMAKMEPIRYTSRDGLTIHGYLTTPNGIDSVGLPVVVNPHGGPWHRDSWCFNREVQFLASRGYAVLQMNFRGSTGYGRAFWEASFKQWGLKMQDDVSDGVKWLIERGVADPKRVAIYGGSYGGYAALAGVTLTPELYTCGVSYVGVSNLFTWMESIPPYWEIYREMLYEMVGHPERDAEQFRQTSPFFRADQIRVPMLVAQGANDPRVPQAESDQIVAALKANDIEYSYLVKEDEGHGFRNEENRYDFYRALEAFLAKHLKGAT